MKIDLTEFVKRAGLIVKQEHPNLPLWIWNYTNRCAYDNAWDEYTSIARGLITTLDGEIVARPFRKFFNLNQRPETMLEALPNEVPKIYEKLDGSLGILYFDGQTPCIATRGSFTSEQAIWATDWIRGMDFEKKDFKDGYTYLFEIIYPENRIVVDYGKRAELVLLAVINTETGNEIDYIAEAGRLGISYAKELDLTLSGIVDSLASLSPTEEGYVVKYSNGFRVKMKGQEYVRLHRLITGFSSKSIWECLMNGQDIKEIIERVPDEFFKWVSEKEQELRTNFAKLWGEAQMGYLSVRGKENRKDQALEIISKHKNLSSAIFCLLDDDEKQATKIIWKMLKPEYELPFKKDIDN